ncbi:KAP family P-loop NTPase fold protein [Pseudomonas leptonychotis]|nr:P-loop NTPase fold protein [Pseudomonas leptonychotis]
MITEEETIWHDDYMDRKKSSDFLTTYLLANSHIKVLNVNSPWGSGKSFFLSRWAKELSKNHICIIFDSWANDFSSEPLIALITCIEQQTKDATTLNSTDAGKTIISAGSNLIKKATPLIAKGLVKKFLGVEIDQLLGDNTSDEVSDLTESLVGKLIEEQSKTSDNIIAFKEAVSETLSQAAEKRGKSSPAFIFIDELDRCRPTYAIELLERIKHFFELEDCRFIVASDSKQLAHSIRAVYGEQFYSERYLARFFDSEFRLDNRDTFRVISENMPKIESLKLGVNISGRIERNYRNSQKAAYPDTHTITCEIEGYSENSLIIAALSKLFDLELRDTIRLIKQIKSTSDFLNEKEFNFFWVAFLIFAKSSNEKLYQALNSTDNPVSKSAEILKNLQQVTISFTSSNTTLTEIALFYLELISYNREQRQRMGSTINGWKESIYNSVIDRMHIFSDYRNVIELAHKLD